CLGAAPTRDTRLAHQRARLVHLPRRATRPGGWSYMPVIQVTAKLVAQFAARIAGLGGSQ
ncbi:hypothetical protein, partial [Rhodococcus phenolicus]|uniref:hypothetical protein n=1 Tax=Rhodococcus phenolicus TaxID=263849 RepID=UPI000A6940E3